MKKTRLMIFGLLVLTLTAFGFGCGGGAGTLAVGGDDGGSDVVVDDGGDLPDGGDGGAEGDVAGDLDEDGIPDDEDTDADGDGFLGSEDDCDDMDPAIFPGAPDKPDHPDYTDSNCDGIDGNLEFGIWVAPDGNDLNPGTIDQPFLTVQAAINAANADLADVRDVYAVEGVYNEDDFLAEGVDIYGGYGPLNPEGLRPREIELHLVQIHSVLGAFVVGPTSTGNESVVEGIAFQSIPDSPALFVLNASPTLRYNRIEGVDSPNTAYSAISWAFGADTVCQPVFSNNQITSGNTFEIGSLSIAFAAMAAGPNAIVEPTLNDNFIRSGNAVENSIGVYLLPTEMSHASLVAIHNHIEAGLSDFLSVGVMMGFDIFESMPAFIDNAEIHRNNIYGGAMAESTIGILAMSAAENVAITNNFITGGRLAKTRSIGIYILNSLTNIYNNSINAGQSLLDSIGIHLNLNTQARVDNNILFAEDSPNMYGIQEGTPFSNPLSLRNNLFDEVLTVYYSDFGVADHADTVAVNAMPDIAANLDNIDGEALFEDILGLDYHLTPDSDAIDVGIEIDSIETDIDGNERPQLEEFDIGADEYLTE